MKYALLFLLCFPAHGAFDFRVIDGDTVNVPMSVVVGMPTRISVRLMGINAPESTGYKCANEKAVADAATLWVRDRLAKATTATVQYVRWDKYGGRIDGRITVDGLDLAQELIKAGFAVPYSGGVRVNVWCP